MRDSAACCARTLAKCLGAFEDGPWLRCGFAVLWLLLNYAMPYMAVTPIGALTLSLTLARKIFFCAMAAALLVAECSVHRMSAALAKLRMPRQVLIPFTVTMRYFPALKDDISHLIVHTPRVPQ